VRGFSRHGRRRDGEQQDRRRHTEPPQPRRCGEPETRTGRGEPRQEGSKEDRVEHDQPDFVEIEIEHGVNAGHEETAGRPGRSPLLPFIEPPETAHSKKHGNQQDQQKEDQPHDAQSGENLQKLVVCRRGVLPVFRERPSTGDWVANQ